MSKRYKRLLSVIISIVLLAGIATAVGAVDIFSLKNSEQAAMASDSDTIILRVCNWEEYIDTGDWDEAIELDSGEIKGENSIVKDFEDWYYQIYGKKVVVEYSTVGTNEELYNMLTLGDEYDLICPSEYMIMKLMKEKKLEPSSKEYEEQIAEYARQAMYALHQLGVVQGMDGDNAAPQANATRAQTAAMLMRFCEGAA